MQPDFEKSAAAMVAGTQKAIQSAVAPLLKRIEELETRQPEKGDPGQPGESIRGETGVGVAGALIDRSGVLILTLSDGTTRELGPVVGKDGEPGKDGADAVPSPPVAEVEEELSDEQQVSLTAMFIQREMGTAQIVELPALPPAKSVPPQVNVKVENHIPRRGKEKTVVTKHDERGRVAEFERTEIED